MTVEERLVRLEKALRRYRWTTLGLLIAVVPLAGFVGWKHFSVASRLLARKVEIVNDKGVTVVVLDSAKGWGTLESHNSLGKPLFMVNADELGDGLVQTFNAKGSEMVQLSTTPTGGTVRLMNNLGREVVGMQSNKSNCGLIMVKDVDGETRELMSASRKYPVAAQPGTTLYR